MKRYLNYIVNCINAGIELDDRFISHVNYYHNEISITNNNLINIKYRNYKSIKLSISAHIDNFRTNIHRTNI